MAKPTIHEFQKAARANVAERSPGDLSASEVQQIRAYRAAGAHCIGIAREMRIDQRDVSKICKFKVRAEVPRRFETDAQREWREWRETKHHQNETEQKKRLEELSAKQAQKDAQAERKAETTKSRRGEGA
jgi:hypothetical protein